MTRFMVCVCICSSRMWLGPIIAKAFAIVLVSKPNRLMIIDSLTYPHCSIRAINVESRCNDSVSILRALESASNVPNLATSGGKSAASLAVLLDGIEEESMDAMELLPNESPACGSGI